MTILCKIQNPRGVTLEAEKTDFQYTTTGRPLVRKFTDQSTQISELDSLTILEGKNTMHIAFGLVYSYQSLSVNNVFPLEIRIEPGKYEVSTLLKSIENQLNSSRVYGDISDASSYMYGGYIFPEPFGSIDCRVSIDESGYFSIDFEKKTNVGDLVYTKVFTGVDVYPGPLDFAGSLPDILGFNYRAEEDNTVAGVLYNKYLYNGTYDPSTKTGKLQADVRKINIGDITRYITPGYDTVEILEGKNSITFGLVLISQGRIITNTLVDGDNLYIVSVTVPVGRYTIEQLLSIIQSQLNEPRLYEEKNQVTGYQPDEYVAGGFDFSNYNAGSVEFSLSLNNDNSLKIYTLSTLNPTYLRPVEMRFAYFAGPDVYASDDAYAGSVAEILKLPRQADTFETNKFDITFYRSFPGIVDEYSETTPSMLYSYSEPLVEDQTLRLAVEMEYTSNSGGIVVVPAEATYPKKKYTFEELKMMVEDLVESGMRDFAGTSTALHVIVSYDVDMKIIRYEYTIEADDTLLSNGIRFGIVTKGTEYDTSLARCLGIEQGQGVKSFTFSDAYLEYPLINFEDHSGIDVDESLHSLTLQSTYDGPMIVFSKNGTSYVNNLYSPGKMEIDTNTLTINGDVTANYLEVDLYTLNRLSELEISSASFSSSGVLRLVGKFYPHVLVRLESPGKVYTAQTTRFINESSIESAFGMHVPPGIYNVVVISKNGHFVEKMHNVQLTY